MRISIIIPVYNAATFLEKAVESVLQFEEVAEIILAEDASTDNSLEVCIKLLKKDNRILLFQHEDFGNHGAAETRNLGIKNATSEYIAFLDSDDYYLPNRFDAEKTIFKNENIEGVFGALGIDFITEKGKEEFAEKFKNNQITTVQYVAEGREVFDGLLGLTKNTFGSFFHLNTLTVKRSSLIQHNLFFNKDLRIHQDSDFITKLAYHCHLKTGIIDQPIAIRGVHDDNRITKIKAYSEKYYKNNFLLTKSLFEWAKENRIEKQYFEKIELNCLSFKIANKKGAEKYLSYFFNVILHPQLLKTKYRFHALHLHTK